MPVLAVIRVSGLEKGKGFAVTAKPFFDGDGDLEFAIALVAIDQKRMPAFFCNRLLQADLNHLRSSVERLQSLTSIGEHRPF